MVDPPVSPSVPPALAQRAQPVAQRYRRRIGKERALLASPAYLFAFMLHAVVLLVLSFWTIAVYVRRQSQAVHAKLAASSEVELSAPQTQSEALDALLEEVEHELDLAVEADTDDPFQEALGNSAGHQVAAHDSVMGLAGSPGGFGRGGSQSRSSGPSSASMGALRAGLDWLWAHRAADGGWAPLPSAHADDGRLPVHSEPAHTGLAVLCYLAAGHSPAEEGPYQEGLQVARDRLISMLGRGELPRHLSHRAYAQAIASLALGELLQRDEHPELRAATERVVKCITAWQSSLGWRYKPREDTDTSVTSWMILALKSAEAAGVEVKADCFTRVRSYLQRASQPDGTTRYTVPSGRVDPAMNATGLFLRILLGQDRRVRQNRLAAELVREQSLELLVEPSACADGEGRELDNLYQLYYAALGMFLYGGAEWRELNPRLRDSVVAAQVKVGDCAVGSWLPAERPRNGPGYPRDRVLNTCLATLILETYFRYLSPDGEHLQVDAELLEALKPTGFDRRLTRAVSALGRARHAGGKGALLVAEAAFREALDELAPGAEPALRSQIKARLVEIAVLSEDHVQAQLLAEDYLATLPKEIDPALEVVRALRLARYRSVLDQVEPAFAPDAEATLQAAALDALATEQLRLRREQAGALEPEDAQLVEAMLDQLGELEQGLLHVAEPDAAIAGDLVVYRDAPLGEPVEPGEWRLVRSLLLRSLRGFQVAARGGRRHFDEAQADLDFVRGRRLGDRLDDEREQKRQALLEQVLAVRVRAQLELGRFAEVVRTAPEFLGAYPASRFASAVISYEQAALMGLAQRGEASTAQRERLTALLLEWMRSDAPTGAEAVAVADQLAQWGVRDEARQVLEDCLTEAGLPEASRVQARLRLGLLALDGGDVAAAGEHLGALPASVADRLDVRRAQARLLRARGEPAAALTRYVDLLRALGDARPPEFWEVAEQTLLTYLEAGDRSAARRFMDGLIQADRDLGGDSPTKDRIVEILQDLNRGD